MKKIIFTLAVSVATVIVGYSNSVSAQVGNQSPTPVNNSKNPDVKFQNNEQSATTGSTFGNDFNPLDLIHNMNMRRSRDSGQFQEDTQNGLNQAADEFKRKQQERMQNSSAGSTVTPGN